MWYTWIAACLLLRAVPKGAVPSPNKGSSVLNSQVSNRRNTERSNPPLLTYLSTFVDFACYCKQARRKLRIITRELSLRIR